jgi:GNAT superfamily N-acetyltransferase
MIKGFDIPIEQQKQEIRDSKRILSIEKIVNRLMTKLDIKFYKARILVTPNKSSDEIIGYGDYIYRSSSADLISHIPGAEELNFLMVNPDFFGNGLGTLIIDTALKIAQEKKYTKFLLRPERPGDYEISQGFLTEEERNYRCPLSVEELQQFYKKFGFRFLTNKEFENYFAKMNLFYRPGAPKIVNYFDIDYPKPEFDDSFKDKVLRFAYNSGLSWINKKIEKEIKEKTPFEEYYKKIQDLKEFNRVNCENYRYVKSYMVKDL